ncbi:MAG: hypothetical protein KH216_12280 [Clostridiales bacterium]|nr:hypothetical protein [Clostridiales bacterium]
MGGKSEGRRRQAEDSRPQMEADCRAPLPSVRAFAYKMKPKRLGKRSVLSSAQITQKSGRKTSRQILAEHEGQSQNRSRRDIRRTNLVSELFEFVDSGKIKLCPAAELSHPKKKSTKGCLLVRLMKPALFRLTLKPSVCAKL